MPVNISFTLTSDDYSTTTGAKVFPRSVTVPANVQLTDEAWEYIKSKVVINGHNRYRELAPLVISDLRSGALDPSSDLTYRVQVFLDQVLLRTSDVIGFGYSTVT